MRFRIPVHSVPRRGLRKAGNLAERVARGIALGVFAAVAAYLAVTSMLTTTVIVDVETVTFDGDSLPAQLAFILLATGAAVLLRRQLLAANSKKLLLALLGFTLLAGCVLIAITNIQPRADQGTMLELARRYVVEGSREGSRYIHHFAHQVGLWLYFIGCTWLTGSGAALLVQLLNVFALCGCYLALYAITGRLYQDRKVTNLLLVLCFCFFPMLFYVTFVYGNLLALMLSLLALYFQIAFMQAGRFSRGLLSVLFIILAIAIRTASLITCAAMIIVYLCHFVKYRRLVTLVTAALCTLAAFFTGSTLDLLYAAMTDGQVPLGIHPLSFVAMGLRYGEYGPGWWDSAIQKGHFDLFDNTMAGQRLVEAAAGAQISETLAGFARDPAAAVKFFHQKAASMWSEPTFQCFWIGTRRASSIPDSPLASFLYYEGRLGNALLRGFLDLFQTLVLVCTAVGVVARRKAMKLPQLLLGVCVVGFFLFHLVWEAKAQYALGYFFLLLPYAAAGLASMAHGLRVLLAWARLRVGRRRKGAAG